MVVPEGEATAKSAPVYASRLFGTEVMTIDIIADETAWQAMLANASADGKFAARIDEIDAAIVPTICLLKTVCHRCPMVKYLK